ncbi:calcium-binding protein [Paracoccus spongiarum]|uniref:Calcium-binding protein n=1 Tax=Paracoccus spongiarum TaxID=3064387 RepID=A0ABT9J7T6_9RHOB|nr:calcium-binding protein [Paracoccus sp. 2205BS29-5]MDP5305873.1 calcium-binding protein [Paracoccus sp. 2205BS29-5]
MPQLVSLDFPATLDLSEGAAAFTVSATAADPDGILQVVVFYDRDITYSNRTGPSESWVIYNFMGLYGIYDSWSDDAAEQSFYFNPANRAGKIDITRIWVEDLSGERRVYEHAELRELDFQTSFVIEGSPPPVFDTYATLSVPDVVTLREGQSLDVALTFLGLTSHYANYTYSFTSQGGTASAADIGTANGSGSIWISSTAPTSERRNIPISASRDGVQEDTETAYLVVNLSGTAGRFEDGGSMKVIEVRILDDNLTVGTAGDDVLHGTSIGETLEGGSGHDIYHVTAGDRVAEGAGAGTDTVQAAVDWRLDPNVEHLTLTGFGNVDGIGNQLHNRITGNAGANILGGGAGDDTLRGEAGNDRLLGHAGTDWLYGGRGHDSLTGGEGNDRLYGEADNDTLSGEAGNDRLEDLLGSNRLGGGIGDDTLIAGTGADWLSGGDGRDSLRAGAGNDQLRGETGNDLLRGEAGHDRLLGHAGIDWLYGGSGQDSLSGGEGNDRLYGEGDNDRLAGEAGNDTLLGGAGRDRLIGDAGADHLFGGADRQRDVFVFRVLEDSRPGAGRDRVQDFVSGIDRIDLGALDADALAPRNQAFDFAGSSASAHSVWTVTRGDNLLVRADHDGDARADLEIQITGISRLTEGDFVL